MARTHSAPATKALLATTCILVLLGTSSLVSARHLTDSGTNYDAVDCYTAGPLSQGYVSIDCSAALPTPACCDAQDGTCYANNDASGGNCYTSNGSEYVGCCPEAASG